MLVIVIDGVFVILAARHEQLRLGVRTIGVQQQDLRVVVLLRWIRIKRSEVVFSSPT